MARSFGWCASDSRPATDAPPPYELGSLDLDPNQVVDGLKWTSIDLSDDIGSRAHPSGRSMIRLLKAARLPSPGS